MTKKTLTLAFAIIFLLSFAFAVADEKKDETTDKEENKTTQKSDESKKTTQKKPVKKFPKKITNKDLEKYRQERLRREREDSTPIYSAPPQEESLKVLGVDQKESYRLEYESLVKTKKETDAEIARLEQLRVYFANPLLRGMISQKKPEDGSEEFFPESLPELDERLKQLRSNQEADRERLKNFEEETRKKGIPRDWYAD